MRAKSLMSSLMVKQSRTFVLALALALLVLGACARINTTQPIAHSQERALVESNSTATEDAYLTTNEQLNGPVMQADYPVLLTDEQGSGTVIQARQPEILDEEPDGTASQAGPPGVSVATHETSGNPFHLLLGPVRTADGSSVHPCAGETPLLCVYQGRTLVGTVELTISPLSADQSFQKVLNTTGIPLGSVDYTDLGNVPLVRSALTAYATTQLADLAQERRVTYADRGYTFAPVAPKEMRIGKLSGVAWGFTGYDRNESVFERRLTYAALDNNALYLFGILYTDGAPQSFLSDRDLVRFEPYLRQILAHLRLPAGEDWRSPGAELIGAEPLLVIQRPDDSIQYVTLDALSAVLVAEAPSSLIPAGYSGVPVGGTPMTDGPIVYVRQLWGGLYALDTIMGQLYPLEFVPPPSPVAVRPLTERLWPEDELPISLAWGEFSASDTATARLYLSAPDGSLVVQALEETYAESDPWTQFVPWRWREDGQLYYVKQLVEGMGGFPPFASAANLWLYDPRDGNNVELISDEVTGGKLCLDAIYSDDQRVAHHCDEGQLTVLDLETERATSVTFPDEVRGDVQLGTARFSPDGSRIAFAAMTGGVGMIEETQGYIAVSDNLSLSGSSHVIVTSQPGEWFAVLGWLSDDRLVLQSYSTDPSVRHWPSVWTVRADGSGLVKLAEGTFLAGFGG